MASKLEAARQATSAGESVIIASGRAPGTLAKIIAGEAVGTLLLAKGQVINARKRWIGLSVKPRGQLVLDDGARRAVECEGRSLLPIGVVDVQGAFPKGAIIALRDRGGVEFARGLTNYSSDELRRIKGLRSVQIEQVLGQLLYEEVIHRNNLLVTS
jgi:glutamate 5-kinase